MDEAVAAWRKVIDLNPKSAKVHDELAWKLAATADKDGRFPHAEQAVQWARRACELAPGKGTHWNSLGVAYYRTKEWRDAVESLQKSIKLGDDVPHNWLFLAMSHWQLDDHDQARKWYDKALAWRKKNNPGKQVQGFFAEAEKLLGEAIKDPKKNTDRPNGN